VIHAGSGGSALNATPAWYGRLASALESAGLPVVLTGSIPETARAHVALAVARLAATRFVAPPSLMGLAAVLDKARIVLGPSTGPLHLAAALGVPTLSFFPPVHSMSPVRWRPRGTVGEVLLPPDHAPIATCMDHIPPDSAAAAAIRLARA
jgi:heptosyltransferase-2